MVSAAKGGIHRQLVLQDEGAAFYDDVDCDEALEGNGGVAGMVETVHED